jgi:uncharacterized membrane protein
VKYPKDRFDDFPRTLKRRGAHRAPRTWASKFMSWIVAIVAFVLLVGIGVGVMWMIDRQVQFTADMGGQQEETTAPEETGGATEAAPTETAAEPEATIDASISLTVLNGVGTPGLATAGTNVFVADGWTVGSTADADSYDYATTSIVIASEDQRGAALGAQETLGYGEITVDPNVAPEGTMTIILGQDAADALL